MDWTGMAALVTAVAGLYALHLKNRLQDTEAQGLKNDVADLERKVIDCEKERDQLRRRRPGRRRKPKA